MRTLAIAFLTMAIPAIAQSAPPHEQTVAIRDRELALAAGAGRGDIYYLSHGIVFKNPDHYKLTDPNIAAAVMAFITASTSNQQIIERCTPYPIGEALGRIDLYDLKWDFKTDENTWFWHNYLTERYPYGTFKFDPTTNKVVRTAPLVIRVDWLIQEIVDQSESDLYLQLLYSGKPPKNRDEFLEFWSVSNDINERMAFVERRSGVAKENIRWLEHRPVARAYGFAWGTRDSAVIDANSDPLEHLTGDFKHDAEEWLVAIPKLSKKTFERGVLMAALLNNAQGEIQAKAPADIVIDKTGVRGVEIRNPLSCYLCHPKGINETTEPDFISYLESGAIKNEKDRDRAELIERLHLSKLDALITRNQDDYVRGVQLATGHDSTELMKALENIVRGYDADVDLKQAAAELWMEPDELAKAIAYGSESRKIDISGRLAGLAHGRPMPRERWEEEYVFAWEAKQLWLAAAGDDPFRR